tara:strand:+ start:351 stop:752 length:402 start_codon:yes stop_codon:yes gene_type:complete
MKLIWTFIFLFFTSVPLISGDFEDVQNTITSQLEAFKKDDFKHAFDYASPSIRSIFQTPENFAEMVKRGYPMVWRPKKVIFQTQKSFPEGRTQDVKIYDESDKAHFLRYFMSLTPKGWKISGVYILEKSEPTV